MTDDLPMLVQDIIEAAEAVHSEMTGRYTESMYHSALNRELSERGIPVNNEVVLPVTYRGATVGYRRPDMVVTPTFGGTLVVELKADTNSGREQCEQYVELCDDDENYINVRGGLLLNFNSELKYTYIDNE